MKQILFLAGLLIVQLGTAQVISNEEEYIVLQNGSKVVGTFEDEDDQYYYFILEGASEAKKIPKSAVKSYQSNELWSQPYQYNDAGEVEYSEVIEISGASKNQLYNAARLWFSDAYSDSKEVLELDDREAGVLIGTGWGEVYTKVMGMAYSSKMWSTVKIQVKDGRYKYSVSNIEIESEPTKYNNYRSTRLPINEVWPDDRIEKMIRAVKLYKESSLLALQAKIDSLKAAMAKAGQQDDDW